MPKGDNKMCAANGGNHKEQITSENICACGRASKNQKLKLEPRDGQWIIASQDCHNILHTVTLDEDFKYCPWCGKLLPAI